MAYGDTTLNADHQWTFNNVLTDSIGSLTLVNTGGIFVTTPITRDSTHSYQTNGRDDLAIVATTTDTGSAGFNRYALGGWFMVSEIQGPPTLIYKQGGATGGFALFLWAGNNVMLQTINSAGNTLIQLFSNIALTDNRNYHFFVRFSGSAYSNEVEFYLDGVKQTKNLDGVAPNTANMIAHTGNHNFGENGTSSIDVPVGPNQVLVKAPINGHWSQWWTWEGANAESITQSEITTDVVAAGAISEYTISSDTESNMQTALDAISDTLVGDFPVGITIEGVSGGGNLNLTADNITFNNRCSINVYYEGSGTLNWTNSNGSNATTGAGNINFLNPSQLTLTNLKNPTEVRVYEEGTQNEVAGQENVTTGSFSATVSTAAVDIRLLSLNYKNQKLANIDMSNDLSIDAAQFFDRQYENA